MYIAVNARLDAIVSLNQIRNLLYRLASLLGDVNAIQKGKIGKRIVRKVATRTTMGWLNRLLK